MNNTFINNWLNISENIIKYLDKLKILVENNFKSNIDNKSCKFIFTPHAGIKYSGLCAMSAYYNSYDSNITNIIIISTDHNNISGIKRYIGSLDFRKDNINFKFKKDTSVLDQTLFNNSEDLQDEHSILNQLPFIHYFYKNKVSILPLIIGNLTSKNINKIIDELKKVVNKNTLVVCTTDISHINGRFNTKINDFIYHNIRYNDSNTIKLINNNSTINKLKQTSMCGANAVFLFYKIRKECETKFNVKLYPRIVCYYMSNQFDKINQQSIDNICKTKLISDNSISNVSYVSIIYSNKPYLDKTLSRPLENVLTDFEKKSLLEFVKNYILNHITNIVPKHLIEPIYCNSYYTERLGVFITLRKDKRLRGCIGTTYIDTVIIDNIKEYALASSFNDSRFTPIQLNELGTFVHNDFKFTIDVKISLLNEKKKLTYNEYKTDKFKLGEDGISIQLKNGSNGFFLPSVAKEDKSITKEKMLELLCKKMNREPICYKEDGTNYYYNEGIDF